jgi:hypothetical protein
MEHEVTIISDDIRHELGRKISLLGLYDRAMVFNSLPARLLKMCVYQRWLDAISLSSVTIELRGGPIGAVTHRVIGKPSEPEKHGPHGARIMLAIGPIDFVKEGKLEILTYFNEESTARHVHEIEISVDPNLKII